MSPGAPAQLATRNRRWVPKKREKSFGRILARRGSSSKCAEMLQASSNSQLGGTSVAGGAAQNYTSFKFAKNIDTLHELGVRVADRILDKKALARMCARFLIAIKGHPERSAVGSVDTGRLRGAPSWLS
jgi:hypothetical protein